MFSYTKKQALQTDDVCLDVSAVNGPVKLFQCHGLGGNQKWEYDKEVGTTLKSSTKGDNSDNLYYDTVVHAVVVCIGRCNFDLLSRGGFTGLIKKRFSED